MTFRKPAGSNYEAMRYGVRKPKIPGLYYLFINAGPVPVISEPLEIGIPIISVSLAAFMFYLQLYPRMF